MEALAPKHTIFIFFFVMIMLFSPAENYQHGIAETPAPLPQPPRASPTNSPTYGTTQGSLKPQECGPRCASRCSNTQYKKPCLFFCNKCCAKCLCVPAGYYGNKQFCPCYNNWKTKRGGPKCP